MNRHVERARVIVRRASGILAALAACMLILLMAITVADVARRTINGSSIEGAVELAPLLLLAAVVLGLGYAEQTLTHVRTSLVTRRLPLRRRLLLRSTGGVAVTALLLWMSWESAVRAVVSIDENDLTPGFVAFHTWPARVLVPIGFLLFAAHVAFRAYDDLRALRSGAPDPRETDPDANAADAPEALVS